MGYTVYWGFKPLKKDKRNTDKRYATAILECQRLVSSYAAINGGIAGYTAHTKPGQYGGVKFNGSGDDGHEDFVLRESYRENDGVNFCKTNNKPYDLLVKACLVILKQHLGDLVTYSSDDLETEMHIAWQDAEKLVLKTTKVQLLKSKHSKKAA